MKRSGSPRQIWLILVVLGASMVLNTTLTLGEERGVQVDTGVARDQLTIPVSPVEDVTDTVLFEGAAEPMQKFYLSRYRLREQTVSGQQQYQMSLTQSEQSWYLTLHLETYPAPEIGEKAYEAKQLLPDGITVILQ